MVHMFPIFSIYFLLFSYVFLHLRLRSQSFFNLLPYMCIIISILFLQIQYPLSVSPLTSNLQKRPNNICSNPSPMRLCGFEITILVYSRAMVQNHCPSTLRLRFCWKSVFSAAPPASPDLLLCSSSRKCHLSFIPSRVFSLPPVKSWLLKL